MPRDFQISAELRVTDVRGLMPPSRRPQRHVMDWTVNGRKRPAYFRWSWHPPTGDLYVGIVPRHVVQLPRNDPERPFASFLRGFLFYRERVVAVRPYWWPLDPYEDFDRTMDSKVTDTIIALLRPVFRNYRIERGIGNAYLAANFSQHASSW